MEVLRIDFYGGTSKLTQVESDTHNFKAPSRCDAGAADTSRCHALPTDVSSLQLLPAIDII